MTWSCRVFEKEHTVLLQNCTFHTTYLYIYKDGIIFLTQQHFANILECRVSATMLQKKIRVF
jgi:hypothetical protein